MPRKGPGPNPNQPSLFAVTPENTGAGKVPTPQKNDLLEQSDIYKRTQGYLDSLTELGRAASNASLVEGVDQRDFNEKKPRGKSVRAAAKRLGKSLDEAGVFWEEKSEIHQVLAERDFNIGFGYQQLVDSGVDPEVASVKAREGFTDFARENEARDKNAKQGYKNKLRRRQKRQEKIQADIDEGKKPGENYSNLQIIPNQITARKPEKDNDKSVEAKKPKYDTIEARDRLRILKRDPKAGFIPFTYRELWQAVDLLHYLPQSDGGAAPGGSGEVAKFLNIVQRRQIREAGKEEAKRAPISLVYEYGDHALDALAQRDILVQLAAELEDNNPMLKLDLALPEGHPGISAIIRYEKALSLREVGGNDDNFKLALTTRKDIHMKPDDVDYDTEKHKTIHSPFTAPEITDEIADTIQEYIKTTNVGTVKNLIEDAIKNETARAGFWKSVLRSAGRHLTKGKDGPGAKGTTDELLAEIQDKESAINDYPSKYRSMLEDYLRNLNN